MPIDLGNVVTVAALIVGSCLIAYLSSRRTLEHAKADAREQLELRLDGFTGTIAELELRIAELTRTLASLSARVAHSASPASAAVRTNGGASKRLVKPTEEIPTEVLIVIGAAVTSFLGQKVRIRSAKMLQSPYEIVNPWAQQGRATVQASHNPRSWSR
jgi:hypothetical protein